MFQPNAMTFKATLDLPHPATIFGITIHGVQPLSFIRDRLHLIDRNLLSKIRDKTPSDADRYWIAQLDSPDVTINPIFAATEGSERRIPSRDEFVQQYFAAEDVVRTYLPNVRLTPHTHETVSKSYALVEDLKERRVRESAFLVKAAPIVAARSSDKAIPSKEMEILSLASTHGLIGGALSLLAVLSCLYESTSGVPPAPGRGVLRPTTSYSPENSHNCLSDLLALELMVVGSSLGIGDNAFISRDKRLARFWQSLGASATASVNGKGTGRFRVTNRLLQRANENDLLRLQEALTE